MLKTHLGEILALAVAFFWTGSALAFEYAGRRVGSLMVNIFRLIFGFLMLGGLLWVISGSPLPLNADLTTWGWMLLSGVIGFVLGDMCLFRSYLIITSRFSQLIMTLSPPIGAIFGFLILGERIPLLGIIAMMVTLFGIGMAIFGSGSSSEGKKSLFKLNLPLRGVLLAFCGALGQGLGIVLSKKGMDTYSLSITSSDINDTAFYIPFAATQIRIIAGIVGFMVIILFLRQSHRFRTTLKDKRAINSIIIGSFCGPFVGVSLALMSVRYTEVGIASTITSLIPIIIIIPSVMLFKQKITAREIVGAFISVCGVALFFIK